MGMPNKQAVVDRLKENRAYVQGFTALFGDAIWSDTDAAYLAMTESIAAFEKTDFFAL